jgi:hypothetical protein
VFDGEAIAWPGVKDERFREKVGRQLLDPFPREAILLTASPTKRLIAERTLKPVKGSDLMNQCPRD